jgi:hypothetical protein
MCTVLLPPGDNPSAVNKYIISYQLQIASGVQTATKSVLIVGFLYEDKTVGGMKLRGHFRIAASLIRGVAIAMCANYLHRTILPYSIDVIWKGPHAIFL